MSDEKQQVTVELTAAGQGTVLMGDVDISNRVSSVTIKADPSEHVTQVTLGMIAIERATATGTPRLDAIDTMVLTSMGWLPPERAQAQGTVNAQLRHDLRQRAQSEAHQLANEREAMVAVLGMELDSAWSEIIARVAELVKR